MSGASGGSEVCLNLSRSKLVQLTEALLCGRLVCLDLADNFLSDAQLQPLSAPCATLEWLDLSGNSLSCPSLPRLPQPAEPGAG